MRNRIEFNYAGRLMRVTFHAQARPTLEMWTVPKYRAPYWRTIPNRGRWRRLHQDIMRRRTRKDFERLASPKKGSNMTPKFEIPDAAVAAARDAFHKTYIGGADVLYREALAAALPFCKLRDAEPQFIAYNRHGKRLDVGDLLHTEDGRRFQLEAVYSDGIHAFKDNGDPYHRELCDLPVSAIPGLTIKRVSPPAARLRLFDGRFTLPLVVKSYPGVSFIHPSNNEAAPVAVVTCDDHPAIAAGIVDAIAAARPSAEVLGEISENRIRFLKAQLDEARLKAAEAVKEVEDTKAELVATGHRSDGEPLNVLVDRAIDAERDRSIGRVRDALRKAALFVTTYPGMSAEEIAEALTGRTPDFERFAGTTGLVTPPRPQAEGAPEVHGWVVPRWRDYSIFLSAEKFTEAEVAEFAAHEVGQGVSGQYYPVAKILAASDSVDRDEAQRIVDEVRNAVAAGIRHIDPDAVPQSRLLETIHEIGEAKRRLRELGHAWEGAPLPDLVGAAIDSEREKHRHCRADILKARAVALGDALAVVRKFARPSINSIAEIKIEIMRYMAEKASIRYRTAGEVEPSGLFAQIIGRGIRANPKPASDYKEVGE